MKKYIFALTIGIFYLCFALFMHFQNLTNTVLDVISPTMLQIDLNNNGVLDDDETVCIPDIESFSSSLMTTANLIYELDLTPEKMIYLGYMADEFSKNLLLLKPVKVKFTGERTTDCRYGEIYVEGEKYSEKLFNAGLAAKYGNYILDVINTNLAHAEKLNLTILNLKSFKYHKLNCEYGLKSSDYTIIPKRQLPKDSQACKFCHTKKTSAKPHTKIEAKPPSAISQGDVRLILTDFTTNLKPHRNCTAEPCITLLNEINNAQTSIDMAIYGWDNINPLREALINAKIRGVKIRVAYDETSTGKYYYKETPDLVKMADISMSDKSTDSNSFTDQLMHNKFVIFDNKTVYTGSMNLSFTGLSGYNANTILLINSINIAKLYTAEFEQMLSGKFHNQKSPLKLENSFQLGNNKVSVYFSPYDRAMQKVIPYINSAQDYIYIPTFLITHTDLTNALIRAKGRGVDVRVIIDANNTATRNTKHALLREHNIQLKTENFAGKMHSKAIIIDNKYVIAGSMNFSNSGENKNDENLLIIENPDMAKFYKSFFLYLWDKIPDMWLNKNVRAESKDSIGACSDGIDNDFDGLIDNADNGCW